jgi:hypothetical protein
MPLPNDGKTGAGEMVKWSAVICHLRMRLRRGIFKKKAREAPPSMTIDN